MTRGELHALVWSQPIRSAAKARGISDVALAKQCRKAGVPVPSRGYWNKKRAGKPVAVQPLPPLPIGAVGAKRLDGLFPATKASGERGASCLAGGVADDGGDAVSPPPVFEDMTLVRQRIEAAVGEVKVPARLAQPHPIVARLLRQDDERRAKVSPTSYSFDYYGPKFDRPIQQRRLRILSTLLLAMDRLGCKASGSTHAGERFSINVAGHWTYILLAVEGAKFGDPFYRGRGHTRQDGERLRFDIVGHSHDREPPRQTWRDDHQLPLESQATAIACGILLKVEEDARASTLWRHRHELETRAARLREAKLAAERAEKDRLAREEAAAKQRIQSLVDGAEALEKAARIRRYVVAVQQARGAPPGSAEAAAVARWASWALAQADSIDPVISGRFADHFKSHEE